MTHAAAYSILALSFLPRLPELRASTQQAVRRDASSLDFWAPAWRALDWGELCMSGSKPCEAMGSFFFCYHGVIWPDLHDSFTNPYF